MKKIELEKRVEGSIRNYTVESKKHLKIETSPNGAELLNYKVPKGYNLIVSITVSGQLVESSIEGRE